MAIFPSTNRPPVDPEILAQVSAAVAASNLRGAADLAVIALARGMRHPTFHNARGLWLQQTRRYQEALTEFQSALALNPGNPTILNAIGLCCLKLDKGDDALRAFDAAIAINPNVAHHHYRRGLTLANRGDHEGAALAHQRALDLLPDFPEALASLASIAARKAQADKARDLAARALALKPKDGTALVALAILDIAEKHYTDAETRLRDVLSDPALGSQPRSAALGLLGDALDGQKRYAEAFQVYIQENEELRREHAPRFNLRAIDAATSLLEYFRDTPRELWRAPDPGVEPKDGPAKHVFLLGFMRSGTTLLEQVLASNPDMVALEEGGLLNGLGDRYLTSFPAIDALASIGGRELQEARDLYCQRLGRTGLDVKGKVFVDKQPLNTVKLPLIAKLFPNAKIIFALRDPRDVVFSCFRRHFKVNATMFEFLNLTDSARFYAAIMALAEVLRDKLPLNLFEHRYEDMVVDFETRVRAVCDFVGVPWNDSMKDFNKYAPAVDLRSPSATQVRKPLYSEALAQWRRYEEQLAPIQPILRPWVEKFGYPVD